MRKLYFILVFFFFECSTKEPKPINYWQKLIDDNKITRVIPAKNDSDFISSANGDNTSGRIFKIDGDFLLLGNNGWNLEKVTRYRIDDIGLNNIALGLIFD